MADVGEEQSDEQMAKDYINSIMYAVPDVERMVPAHRPVKILWKEINAFYARGIAAMKAGESAKAYIYLSQYAMAVMHPVKGISRHPHYTEIDAGDRDKAKIIGKKVLERVERLQEEVKADFVRKMHQKRREKAEAAAKQAKEQAIADAQAAAQAEAAAAAASAAAAAAQTASLDSLRGLVGPASGSTNQPSTPVAAPSSMYNGLAGDIRPPAAIDIPPPSQRVQLEPEPEPVPRDTISGSPPSYPGPVPGPAAAVSGPYQPPAHAPGYQPPPAHAPGYQPPPVDPSWGAGGGTGRPLPPAIGSLASQQQAPSVGASGAGAASAPPPMIVPGGSSGAPFQQPAERGPVAPAPAPVPAPAHPGAAPAPRTLGDARSGYQGNLPPAPWEVPRGNAAGQNQPPPAQSMQPPPAYRPGRAPPLSDRERAYQAASQVQPRAPAPASAHWPQPQQPSSNASPAPAPSSGSSGGGGSSRGGRTGRPPRTIKVYGDGHCMYRSVACHLNPDIASLARNEFGIIIRQDERPIEEAAAISLRSRVASYMESHWDEFPTVLEEERSQRVAGIRGREWGGEEEVSVLAAVTKKTIVVHDISRGHELPYSPPSGGGDGDKIHLRYTRNEEAALVSGDLEAGGHYDLLAW